MPIEVDNVGSPGWHLSRLARKLEGRSKRLDLLAAWYEGNPPLPEGLDPKLRPLYRALLRMSRTNFAELAVEAPRERMLVGGFRTAELSGGTSDDVAAAIWSTNGGPVLAADVHADMLSMGDSYVIVGHPEGSDLPVITAEDPRQVVTTHDPTQQRIVRSAAKFFHDPDEDVDYGYLYLPGRVYVAYREMRRRAGGAVRFSPRSWDWDESRGGSGGVATGLKHVPVVRFRNRRGVGQFEPHLDLLERLNYQVSHRLVISAMQAFRQRAVEGTLPDTDNDGNPIDYDDIFRADPGALWELPDGVKLWESTPTDVSGILNAVEADLQALSAVTRVPLHVFSPDAARGSAEGASLSREGLVFMTEDRIARATEGWRDVMWTSFLYLDDDKRSDRTRIEVLWAPPERRSLAENADANVKLGDVPWRTRMSRIMQFSEVEIDRMETERAADAIQAAALAGLVPQGQLPLDFGGGDAGAA